jgi:hypothetical protein
LKDLLTAIQTQLRTDLTYIRDSDIYIAPHENYIPGQVRPPCVGIKDGAIVRKELVSSMLEVTLNVTIVIMVQLAKDEASIIGDAATGKKGVLEIADDIHTALDENLLDIDNMQEAYSPSEEASVLFGDEKEALQRKLITYQYIREGLRP